MTPRHSRPVPQTDTPDDHLDTLVEDNAESASSPESAAEVARAAGPHPAGPGMDDAPSSGDRDDAYRLDVNGITDLLAGRWKERRMHAREIAGDPQFAKPMNMLKEEHRELTLQRLKKLAEIGWAKPMLPVELGGEGSPGGNIALYEELVVSDPSLQIKAGVQFGLFASAILNLGTEEHHAAWLDDAVNVKLPGVYAMTEIGHGSDVSAVGTTATYDEATEEWVIHTPFEAAKKEFLGNAALHGKAAVVFAQLITKGVNHGVHCFFVPIRDDDGEHMPGVSSEDDGEKNGLNGIDNGRLAFDHVRIPRTNLLNRYGDVAADGTYSSEIDSPGRRFFTMLTTLVQGRVSLDGAAVRCSELALAIALLYANERRQFADSSGTGEVKLLDYQVHQRRLFPLLARTYAHAFAHEELLEAFHDVFSGEADTQDNREDLETMAAALKPASTWLALETLQECREACGGAGYMAKNRLGPLHADMDVFATFEGDNHVLLQLVGKRLLGDYAKSLRGMDAADVGKFIAGRADVWTSRYTPWRRLLQSVADLGSVKRSAVSLRDEDLQVDLFSQRARVCVEELGLELRQISSMDRADAAALVNANQVELIEAARAHVDLILLTAFNKAIKTIGDKPSVAIMRRVRDLFALTTIEKNLAWYIMHGYISLGRARTLPDYINRLLEKLRPHILDLVAAFDVRPEHMRAEIATGIEAKRQEEANQYYRKQRASSEAPINEKVLRAQEAAARKEAERAAAKAQAKGGKPEKVKA